MKSLKIFSIAGAILVAAIIICQIVFNMPVDAKLVASVITVIGIVFASRMLMKIEPQSLNTYKKEKAEA